MERHTGESPETCHSTCFDEVRSDLSSFIHHNPFRKCELSNGPGVDSNEHSVNPTNDARHASNVGDPLTQSQAEFWYLVEYQGPKVLADSLKMIHDLALYHSDIPFDIAEK